MPEDTTGRTTKRPNVSEELDEQLADAVNEHVRIPSDRLSFGDRLQVLLEEYEARGEEIEGLKDKLAVKDKQIEELEEQLADARTGGLVRG